MRTGRPPTPAIDRFLPHVVVESDTGCWLWTAGRNPEGYAVFREGSNPRGAQSGHRFAYKHFVGEIPDGMVIDHLCRVRHCVNPAHLEAVTCRENLLRGVGWGAANSRKTRCPKGHEYDARNTAINRDGGRRCRACTNHRRPKEKAA